MTGLAVDVGVARLARCAAGAAAPAVDVALHAVEPVIGALVGDAHEHDRVAGPRRAVVVDSTRDPVSAPDAPGSAAIDPRLVAVEPEVLAVVADALVRQVLAEAPSARGDASRRRGAAVGVCSSPVFWWACVAAPPRAAWGIVRRWKSSSTPARRHGTRGTLRRARIQARRFARKSARRPTRCARWRVPPR